MKKVYLIIILGICVLSQSCTRWPQLIIGDSSGILTYNRHTGQLEVLWEKHAQVVSPQADSVKADSIPMR